MRFADAIAIREKMRLDRPLTFFDVETTGQFFNVDRVIQLGYVRIPVEGEPREGELNFNPDMAIPAETTAIHGITNDMVRHKPRFADMAEEIAEEILDGDLAAFNGKFDVGMIRAEMERARQSWDHGRLIDPFKIYVEHEGRRLEDAVKHYLGETMANAHTALPDTRYTVRVFHEQLNRYDDVPKSVDELHRQQFKAIPEGYADPDRKLAVRDGKLILTFGKHQGKRIKDQVPRDYVKWMLGAEFSDRVKSLLREEIS